MRKSFESQLIPSQVGWKSSSFSLAFLWRLKIKNSLAREALQIIILRRERNWNQFCSKFQSFLSLSSDMIMWGEGRREAGWRKRKGCKIAYDVPARQLKPAKKRNSLMINYFPFTASRKENKFQSLSLHSQVPAVIKLRQPGPLETSVSAKVSGKRFGENNFPSLSFGAHHPVEVSIDRNTYFVAKKRLKEKETCFEFWFLFRFLNQLIMTFSWHEYE